MRISSFNKCVAIQYDFDRDGGAVGSIPQNIIIPTGAMIWYLCFRVQTGLTGGAGAVISIGWDGFPIVTGLAFAVPVAPTANLITAGVPSIGLELKVFIQNDVITAGKFFAYIGWFEGKMPS